MLSEDQWVFISMRTIVFAYSKAKAKSAGDFPPSGSVFKDRRKLRAARPLHDFGKAMGELYTAKGALLA